MSLSHDTQLSAITFNICNDIVFIESHPHLVVLQNVDFST